MRRPNGGVIWLLIAGAAMAFAFNQIASYFLLLRFMIPSFIILVLGGYICARVIGQVGGEFSAGAKGYSIILEGFVFGLAFDLLRFRYDWFINVFKHIAIGAMFILMAMVFKRNLEKYTDKHPTDGPHLGLMRPSFLYIMAGINFGFTISSVFSAFLNSFYFIGTLSITACVAIFIMIFSKGDYDLLESDSGVWQQLLAGGVFGFIIELIFFKIITWQDLLKLFVVFVIVAVTGFVIRNKEATLIKTDRKGIKLDPKKSKKRVVGSIELEPRRTSGTSITTTRKKKTTSSKKKSSSSKKRR
ncbi:MAG: hypothetical protein FK733_19155 [Asgard group archaeon]|nr:hypothetical protein [Asgard group archaeon]